MSYKKLYIGSYQENEEADLSQHIVLEEEGDAAIYTCTTLGGLLQMISDRDKEIMKLCDALEECGMRVCPICGDVTEIDDMKRCERENLFVCSECAREG